MIGPFEYIETFDVAHYARAAQLDISALEPLRPLMIVYALAAEIRPRAAVCHLNAPRAIAVCVAALNAGYFEELHCIFGALSLASSRLLARARIPRRVHTYSTPPVITEADFWIVAGADRPALRRAADTHPALIVELPAGAPGRLDLDPAWRRFVDAGGTLAVTLRSDRVNDDVLRYAQDLCATSQTWWATGAGSLS